MYRGYTAGLNVKGWLFVKPIHYCPVKKTEYGLESLYIALLLIFIYQRHEN